MLHKSNFIMIFYVLVFASLLLLFIRTDAVTQASKQNIEYGRKLTSASHSAMQSLEPQKVMAGKYIWSNKEDRKKAIETFYYSLNQSFMNSTNNDRIQVTTPIVLLIDTDGYYIGYNALFNSENMLDPSKENEYADAIQVSELNTWSEELYGCYVRYYLNDNVIITDPIGKTFKGDRHLVADQLKSLGYSDAFVEYLNGTEHVIADAGPLHTDYIGEKVEVNKTDIIVDKTQNTLNKYINEYNYSAGNNGGGYKIVMPNISGEMWHRLLENPTIISFIQGHNIDTGKEVINTFAYSGGEIIKADKYFITDVGLSKKYHSMRECLKTSELKKETDGTYKYTAHDGSYDVIVDKFYFTMQECAEQGASPCPDCIR